MDLLTKGQKITLFFQKDLSMVEMTCTIEKVMDDRLHLLLPQYFMRYVNFLQVGEKMTAKVFSKFGTIDFNTIVISSPLEESFSIELDYNSLMLTSGDKISQIQAVEKLTFNDDNIINAETIELSTEYIKFTSPKPLAINKSLDFSLTLPEDYGIINFKAIITESDPIYENEYTASYVTMTEQNRQALLYYMYMYEKDDN